MGYDTTTISNLFEKLYNVFRRKYAQYAVNMAEAQYLIFANISYNRSYKLPYYFSAQGAHDRSNPDGYLPADLSPYYLQERPVYFFDRESWLSEYLKNQPHTESPVFILNLFIGGDYQDVYINYDERQMEANIIVMDASLFTGHDTEIYALQSEIDSLVQQTTSAYNKSQFLASSSSKAASLIDTLRADPRFIVKVASDCDNKNFIQLAVGLSLTWMQKQFDYPGTKTFLENQGIGIAEVNTTLKTQVDIQGAAAPVAQATEQTTTAPAKPAVLQSTFPWWILLVCAGFVVAGSGSGRSKD